MDVDQQKLEMENAIYEACNLRSLLKMKVANPGTTTNTHNRMEVVVNKATRFWQDNRKVNFCDECDFERKEKRKREAPPSVASVAVAVKRELEEAANDDVEDIEEETSFAASRFSASLKRQFPPGAKSSRASIRHASAPAVELSLVPLGEPRSKQPRLDIKPVTREPSPPQVAPPPAAAAAAAEVAAPRPSFYYRVYGMNHTIYSVFSTVSVAMKRIVAVPDYLEPYVKAICLESPEAKKAQEELAAIIKEADANDGMTASAQAAIKQSENCASFTKAVITQMKDSARQSVHTMKQSKRQYISLRKPVARVNYSTCEEITHMRTLLQRILPPIDIVENPSGRIVIPGDHLFDPYLPLLALNGDLPASVADPISIGQSEDMSIYSGALRELSSSLRLASAELVMCEMTTEDPFNRFAAVFDQLKKQNYIQEMAQYLHLVYYASILSKIKSSNVKLIQFTITTSRSATKAPTAFMFVYYNSDTKSLQMSDLVFLEYGFDRRIVYAAITKAFGYEQKLENLVRSMCSGFLNCPRYVICPRWMERTLKFTLKSSLYHTKKWKRIHPESKLALSGHCLNEALRRIFLPWWAEFVSLPR